MELPEEGHKATIWDAYHRYQITGAVFRRYEKGLTVEDSRGVIHYATFDRLVKPEEIR